MEQALDQARLAYHKGEIPVGALVVKDNEIIARAHNLKEAKGDATQHAEILAIQEASRILASWWLEDCDMYVSLEPCPMCAGAILNARMRKVYIGARDCKMGACGGNIDLSKVQGFNHSFDVEFGLMEDQSKALLENFFKKLRAK